MNLNLSDTSDDDTEIYESKLKKKHSRLRINQLKTYFIDLLPNTSVQWYINFLKQTFWTLQKKSLLPYFNSAVI